MQGLIQNQPDCQGDLQAALHNVINRAAVIKEQQYLSTSLAR
jgi:hypothetical protein